MAKIVSMSSGAIDPIAQTKSVFWRPVTDTTVLKVGQPVCYHSDSVLDHKDRTGDPTHLGLTVHTYAEGAQDKTARLFCVEEPLTANLHAFAGIVKALGPKAGKDGDMIEIFVPNGAILPCWIDQSVTLESTVLGIRNGAASLSYPGRPIGIAQETINRTTAGLCWVKIDPNAFGWLDNEGAALSMGADATANAYLVKVNYAHISGYRTALMIQQTNSGALASAGGSSAITGYINQTGAISTSGYTRAILGQLNVTGTVNNGGAHLYGIYAQIHGSATLTHCQRAAGLMVEYALTIPVTGDSDVVFLYANPSGGDLNSFVHMFGDGEKADVIWKFSGCGGLSTSTLIKKMGTGGMWDNAGAWIQIPIDVAGTTYYIAAGALLSEA